MNWADVIRKIMASGLNQTDIAKEVGHSATWVRKVLSGEINDVSWAAGQSLLKIERRTRRKMQMQ